MPASNLSSSSARIGLFAPFLLTLLAACGVGEANIDANTVESRPLPVDAVEVVRADLYASYQATSTLSADGEAQVPAKVSGEVVEIFVEEGDRVVQGQLLAQLDDARLSLKLKQTQAELARLESEFERQQDLHRRGIISSSAFEGMQFELDALTAAWDLGRLDLSCTEIRAPISGVVSAREINLGQQLRPGDLTFRISDTSVLVAELKVPQTELAAFSAGMPVTLAVDAAADTPVQASVERISPTISKVDGSFRVTVYVDNAAGLLAPGMFTRATVHYRKQENAMALPAPSVVEEDGEFVVYVINNGVVERRAVEVGVRNRDQVQILHGVADGERVIRSKTTGLRDGTRVVAMHDDQPVIGG